LARGTGTEGVKGGGGKERRACRVGGGATKRNGREGGVDKEAAGWERGGKRYVGEIGL